jgi:hypothetical protein
MTQPRTEVQVVGEEDDLLAFCEHLADTDGDLSILIYRQALDEWSATMSEEVRTRVATLVGSPMFATVTEGPQHYQDRMSMMLEIVGERFALREALCLRTLFDFAVAVWLVDPVTGRSDHVAVGD